MASGWIQIVMKPERHHLPATIVSSTQQPPFKSIHIIKIGHIKTFGIRPPLKVKFCVDFLQDMSVNAKFATGYKAIQVGLLDGTTIARSIYKQSKVGELIGNLLQMFNVVEKDYFGIYYLSDRKRIWLDGNKKIWPQIKHLAPPYHIHFGMQFYPRDPVQLQEEITSFLMFLQLKRDVIEARLVVNVKDRAEMCAFILQAEGAVSSSDSYLAKHRSFFVHLQQSSADFEARILEILYNLSGMDGILAEARLIERAIPLVQYDIEPFPVRSEAHPSLRSLSLVIGPIGITIFQDKNRIEIFHWTEIWNAGYSDRTFWFRIFRENENSRHKYNLANNKLCKLVWKLFKVKFKFYVEDHTIPPKLAWGRVAPNVNRANLLEDSGLANQVQIDDSLIPKQLTQAFPIPTTEL